MVKSRECIRFDDEQTTTANSRDPVQFACLANLVRSKGSPPAAPQVLFVLAADKPLEVDSPYHVVGTHEVQRREGDCNRRCPTVPSDSCLRSPNAIPARIAVLRITSLLVRNECVPLRPQWIDLEHVSIAAVVSGIDHNLKVVIKFLSHVPAQLTCHNSVSDRIPANNPEVDFVTSVENPDFCCLGCGLPLVGFFLPKVCNRNSFLPDRIVECTVQFGRTFDRDGLSNSQSLIRDRLAGGFCRLCQSVCTQRTDR